MCATVMDSDGANLRRMTETSFMILGTALRAGWLPSTSYHLANEASHGHSATSPTGRAAGKWERRKGRGWGPSRKRFHPQSRTTSKMGGRGTKGKLGQWIGGRVARLEFMSSRSKSAWMGTGDRKSQRGKQPTCESSHPERGGRCH